MPINFAVLEDILANVSTPDKFYDEVLVPLKVELAMEHVDRNSLTFDLKILCQTAWMLTFGRLCPIEGHPAIEELKEKLKDYKTRYK